MRHALLCVLSLQLAADVIRHYDPAWAVCLNPIEVAPRAYYATELTRAGHHQHAVDQGRILTAMHPADAVAWQILAQAQAAAGDMASAEEAMLMAAALDPTFKPIQDGLAAIRIIRASRPLSTERR